MSSKGRQYGYCRRSVPILPTLVPIMPTRGTHIALPRVGNMGSVPILPPSGRQYGYWGVTGSLSMGFYNGRGVCGTPERIREMFFLPHFFVDFLPPFLLIFFQGGLYGYGGVYGYMSMGFYNGRVWT